MTAGQEQVEDWTSTKLTHMFIITQGKFKVAEANAARGLSQLQAHINQGDNNQTGVAHE
jgi:hypothetical protein